MKYVHPKTLKSVVKWEMSDSTISLIEHYAKYTKYSESEVVDMFMKNIATDELFIEWGCHEQTELACISTKYKQVD